MKFLKVDKEIKVSGMVGREGVPILRAMVVQNVWDSEDGRYRLATTRCSGIGTKSSYAIRVSIQQRYSDVDVIAHYGRNAKCIVCEDDGVSSFMVHELMDMVRRYGHSYEELFGRVKQLRLDMRANGVIAVSLHHFAKYRSEFDEIR